MITITDLSKVYPAVGSTPPVEALKGVSLTVDQGHVQGIIGPSGSGKSTLGRCLTLLEQPSAGSIQIDGQELTTLDGASLRAARRKIGVIFQAFNLLDSRTALGNVELPLELAGVKKDERRERARHLLDRVGLADKAGAHPAQLSGGQQQRVAIARALVTNPSVLISDEATSALDPDTTRSIIGLLAELTAELQLTTLLITHQPEVVQQACDNVATLSEGRIVARRQVRGDGAERRLTSLERVEACA